MMAWKAVLLLLLGFVAVSYAADGVISGKKKTKDWNSMDWDSLDKEWEDGDEDEELLSDHELLQREIESRKGIQPQFNPDDPNSLKAYLDNQAAGPAGPTMVFGKLKTELNKEEGEAKCQIWLGLLQTGGVQAQCYYIAETSLLVSLQKGWYGTQVKLFLLDQPEVDHVLWDSKKYFADGRQEL